MFAGAEAGGFGGGFRLAVTRMVGSVVPPDALGGAVVVIVSGGTLPEDGSAVAAFAPRR